MRSWMSLIQGTLIPPTRVYRDSQGNFAGTSTDITPAMILLCRVWGFLIFLRLVLAPILAPVYLLFVHWYCKKFDTANTKEDPKGWPIRKKKMINKYTWVFVLWCGWIAYGYWTDWGVNDLSYEYTQPSVAAEQYRQKHGLPHRYWDPETSTYKEY